MRRLLPALLATELACGSNPPPPPPPPACLNRASDGGAVSFSGDVQPVFDFHCASCHTEVHDVDFTLAPDASYAALVNRPCSPTCNSRVVRVKPGVLSQSMLWLKLSNDPAECNAPMPRTSVNGLVADCPADAQQIRAWILGGASNN